MKGRKTSPFCSPDLGKPCPGRKICKFYCEWVFNLKQNDFSSPKNAYTIIYKLGVTLMYNMIFEVSLVGKRNMRSSSYASECTTCE